MAPAFTLFVPRHRVLPANCPHSAGVQMDRDIGFAKAREMMNGHHVQL
jgi:hypothetical protein